MLPICRKPRLSVDYSSSYKIGHACRKLNFVLISRLTGKRETQDLKKLVRNAPFDIWGGGGGLEFLLLANFFFTFERKQSFFGRSTTDNFFFMFRRRNFLSYAFPIMYVTI